MSAENVLVAMRVRKSLRDGSPGMVGSTNSEVDRRSGSEAVSMLVSRWPFPGDGLRFLSSRFSPCCIVWISPISRSLWYVVFYFGQRYRTVKVSVRFAYRVKYKDFCGTVESRYRERVSSREKGMQKNL